MGKRCRDVLAIAVSVLAVAWAANCDMAFLDEGRTPPDAAFPALPGQAVVKGISKDCGSGGCWSEMAVDAGSADAAGKLIKTLNLSQEHCSPRSLLTLNRTCTGASQVGGEVRVFLRYSY